MKYKGILSGVKWTIFSSIFLAILQIIQLVIIARFISKEDFGVVSIVIVFIGFLQIFMDAGISNAVIHAKKISEIEVSSLFWLNIFIAIFLMSIIYFASGVIATFYNNNSIKMILYYLSFILLAGGIGVLYKTFFQKDLYFGLMGKIDIVSALLSFFVTYFLAIYSYGVYALISGVLVGAIFSGITYFYLGVKQYGYPRFLFSFNSIKNFLSFGFYQLGERNFIYIVSQMDTLIIGKILGMNDVGLYGIAKNITLKIINLVNPVISRINLPLMVKATNDVELKNQYLFSVQLVSFILAPILILILNFSHSIILILFGSKWVDAVPVLQLLCVYMYIRSVGSSVGAVLLAKNKPKIGFYWNMIILFLMPIVILIGAKYKLVGVCYGLILFIILLKMLEYLFIIKRNLDIVFFDFLDKNFRAFYIALLALISVYFYSIELVFWDFLVRGIQFVFIYLFLTFFFNKEILLNVKNNLGFNWNRSG